MFDILFQQIAKIIIKQANFYIPSIGFWKSYSLPVELTREEAEINAFF